MPVFIKFTEMTTETKGHAEEIIFINPAQIASARFSKKTGDLTIVMMADPTKTAFRIKGEEALDAIAVLQRCDFPASDSD